MALSLRRWVSIAAIGFGIAIVAILRDVEPRTEFVSRQSIEEQRAGRARHRVAIASERLRILELVDSVRRTLGTTSSPQTRVAISRGVDERVQRGAHQIVSDLATRRQGPTIVPVDIAFVVDSVSTVRGAPRIGINTVMALDHVLPRPNSNDRCLVLARTKPMIGEPRNVARRFVNLVGEPVKERFLGPCAYYERFGAPGPHIANWLREREWGPGVRSVWDKPARQFTWGWATYDMPPERLEQEKAMYLRVRMTPQGIACVSGDVSACEKVFGTVVTGLNRVTLWSTGVVSSRDDIAVPYYEWWWEDRKSPLGPSDWTLLSEMVRTLGPERFQRFWTSDQPIDAAFRTASGTDIGTWTRDWAQRMYGAQVRGPQLGATSAAGGVAFIALAIVFAALTARRRQVS
jgi:hypothetical protein